MRESRDVKLETAESGVTILVRGERVARYSAGFNPGFRDIRVADRSLIVEGDDQLPGLSILHGNIGGVRFGSAGNATPDAASGRILTNSLTARRGSHSVGFRHSMDWQDPAGSSLIEVVNTARATSASSGGMALDISLRFRAGEQDEVLLGATRDSLLHLQLSGHLFPDGGGLIRNGLGDFDVRQVNGRRAPWFGCVGVIEGETVGIALIDHPDNPTHPPTWRINSDCGILLSPFETCSITLMSNESVTLRFRLQTHIGYVDEGWATARAAEFAREPIRM